MMEKAPKSREELERLVLAELKTCGECDGAEAVSIIGCEFDDGPLADAPNWTVEAFNPGSASDYECERALIKIVSRFQGFYKLVQKH